MKQIAIILLSLFFINCAPPVDKPFSKKTLASTLTTIDGVQINLSQMLEKHNSKTVIIDVWASWCGDCIRGLPSVKSIQKKYPKAEYVFISLDSNEKAWKRGINRYAIEGNHYFASGGWKSDFAKNDNIKWIPTYILISPNGEIVYRSKSSNSSKFLKLLNNTYHNEK